MCLRVSVGIWYISGLLHWASALRPDGVPARMVDSAVVTSSKLSQHEMKNVWRQPD